MFRKIVQGVVLYTMRRQYENKKVLLSIIVIIAVFLSTKTFNDYRERNLADAITYKPSDFMSTGFTKDLNAIPINRAYEWWTEEQEPTEELMEFLTQYRVKKVSEEKYNERTLNRGCSKSPVK